MLMLMLLVVVVVAIVNHYYYHDLARTEVLSGNIHPVSVRRFLYTTTTNNNTDNSDNRTNSNTRINSSSSNGGCADHATARTSCRMNSGLCRLSEGYTRKSYTLSPPRAPRPRRPVIMIMITIIILIIVTLMIINVNSNIRTQTLDNITPLPMKKRIPEQPSPWRKSSKRESCYGDRVYHSITEHHTILCYNCHSTV